MRATFLLLTSAAITAHAALAAPTNGDKYCTDKNTTTFLARHAGNDLQFSIFSVSGRGSEFNVSGTAHLEAGGWLYQEHMNAAKLESRCEAHIVAQPAGGYTFWLTPAGPCSEEQGWSYKPNEKVAFPARSRHGGIPANKTMEQASSMGGDGEWCR